MDVGEYRIETAYFDGYGDEVVPVGMCPVYKTGLEWSTFAIIKSVGNMRADLSPYGGRCSRMDAMRALDLASDAMISEFANREMRLFLSDVMFNPEEDWHGRMVSISFGGKDRTVL